MLTTEPAATLMESALAPAVLFQSVDVQDKPYRFFTCEACLRADLAESLLVWLENGIKWSLAESEFYRQWECYLLSLAPPDNVAILFAPETLQYLRERVGELLAVQLGERLTIVAHKLVLGQFIDVHNDDPAQGRETHRLVIQLNRGGNQHSGGELRIHNSSKPADVFCVVPPVHNSAFGFEMTPNSFHSVMPMRQGTRYTIIFSFWSKAAEAAIQKWQVKQNLLGTHDIALKTASEIAGGLDPAELARLEQLTEFLQSLGTGGKEHSGKTLLAHLVHTYLIIRSWDCSVDLAAAGLFHSIYGTSGFTAATLALADRGALAQIIGAKAERLAYLFCACTRESLFANVAHAGPYHLYDRFRQEDTPIDRETLCQLLTLDLANSLEQLPRLTETDDIRAQDKQHYDRAISFLPELAVSTMRGVYAP